jgi:hypothetical protein
VGNVHVTALLLERGADVTSSTADGWTPLHGAAVEGELGTVRLLLERGADPNAPTHAGRTPLDIARDDATKIVIRACPRHGYRGTLARADASALFITLLAGITQASQAAGTAAGAAALLAPALAAATVAATSAVPADVAAWFEAQGVDASFAAALGCESLRDVTLLREDDLREVHLKPAQRRRLMAAAAEMGGAPAKAAPAGDEDDE